MLGWRRTPADGRGEVRVQGRGQAVMVVLGRRCLSAAQVNGLHHAPGGHDAHLRPRPPAPRPYATRTPCNNMCAPVLPQQPAG